MAESFYGPVAKFHADEGDATITLMSDGRVFLSHPGLSKGIEIGRGSEWVTSPRALRVVKDTEPEGRKPHG